jgi:hypothetical protein
MNTTYRANSQAINLLPPMTWDGYEPEKLANLSHEQAWQIVREFPACVGAIPNAIADMQAYPLLRQFIGASIQLNKSRRTAMLGA